MRLRFAAFSAIASIVGLLTWLSLGQSRGPTLESPVGSGDASTFKDRAGGSALPCAVPVAWRIARVDPEFGLGAGEPEAALGEAIALWEEAVGRSLFSTDAAEGFPIRLVYDARQARTEERRRLEDELERAEQELEAERAELAELTELHARGAALHAQQARDLERRISLHNATARRWNESGRAPENLLEEHRAAAQALERERLVLQDRASELEALRRRVREETDRLNQRIGEHNRRAAALERRFPPTPVESGVYREATLVQEGRVASLRREIRIYRFEDEGDLVRVIAHELGHALGLGHTSVPDALMSEAYGRAGAAVGRRGPEPDDVERLRSRCPALFDPKE